MKATMKIHHRCVGRAPLDRRGNLGVGKGNMQKTTWKSSNMLRRKKALFISISNCNKLRCSSISFDGNQRSVLDGPNRLLQAHTRSFLNACRVCTRTFSGKEIGKRSPVNCILLNWMIYVNYLRI